VLCIKSSHARAVTSVMGSDFSLKGMRGKDMSLMS